jgi:Domain of unknown function (DUF4440)
MKTNKSLEVRWFTESSLENIVKHWQTKENIEKPKVRTDYYLSQKVLPETTLGIKLREGDFEVKSLLKIIGEKDFGNGIVGIVQEWQKGIKIEIDETFEKDLCKCIWIAVKKERYLFKFDCTGEKAILVKSTEIVDEGCNGEITKIEVLGKTYWSIALEAFGSDDKLLENFDKTVKIFLNVKVSGLDLSNSKSYPAFLSSIENNSLEAELTQINEDFSKAELTQDIGFFQDILSGNLAFRRANGTVVSKADFLASLPNMTYHTNKTSQITIRQILPDTYAVSCIVEAKGVKQDGSPFEGKFSNNRLFRLESGKFKLFSWHNVKI